MKGRAARPDAGRRPEQEDISFFVSHDSLFRTGCAWALYQRSHRLLDEAPKRREHKGKERTTSHMRTPQRSIREERRLAKLDLVETATPPPPLKVALTGKAIQKYEEARKMARQYLASPSCSKVLKRHWFDGREVASKRSSS